jgi:single-stranded-DNA-specific exonuclease
LLAERVRATCNLDKLLAQCLINRGLDCSESISTFLDPRLQNLSDPCAIPGMTATVERLFQARERREPLVIFGDYDVDGVTATSLLLEVLSRLGWTAHYFLPHRIDEGYGMTSDAVDRCLATYPVSLILAVDCGSASAVLITELKARNIQVIVLDHHQCVNYPHDAVAVVNPHASAPGNSSHNPEANGLFSELCSVGLAFKLAHAIVKRARQQGISEAADFDIRPLLDLVALGSIADVVPLVRENRILVSAGLRFLRDTKRPGLLALKKVAGLSADCCTEDVGFALAPRLNAAGRLETAQAALQLLIEQNADTADKLAESLERQNQERRSIERAVSRDAIAEVEGKFKPDEDHVIVVGRASWHIGVVGIVASRVLQKYYRPTIIAGGDGEHFRGSGRSIHGFDMAAALRECGDLLIRHGGHAMAAGISIQPRHLEVFRDRLNECAKKFLKGDLLQCPLNLDGEAALSDISVKTVQALDRLKPFGPENSAPKFFSRKLSHARPLQKMGADKQHVKMWVTDGASTREAVWWGAGNGSLPVGQFDLAYEPRLNSYNGAVNVQLKALDWRPEVGETLC